MEARSDRAGGVQRSSEGPAIEGAHFEIAVVQREIGGGVGDFDLAQAETSDVDGAIEQAANPGCGSGRG